MRNRFARTAAVVAAAGALATLGAGVATAEDPAPTFVPPCATATPACTPSGDRLSWTTVYSDGIETQNFDKLGNPVCKSYPGDPSAGLQNGLCDFAMTAVRQLPPLPLGTFVPRF